MADAGNVPASLARLIDRLRTNDARQVRITQRGQMWLKPDARGMSFTAVQRLAVERVAFSWRARFPIGPLALSVVDEYDTGVGGLTVSLYGLPLQRQRGPETTAGQALRYLAELPFVPLAVRRNDELEFAPIDERHVEVATSVAGERVAVTLELDDEGNIIRASSTMRKLRRNGAWRATAWGGEFQGYRQVGPLYLPTTGEAYWELESGRYTYWRGTITDASLLEEPFTRQRGS
ncbi:MAG TPA: DUF6544 family protein [Gaiellaceae bacterium]|nr:DUF6544 family protein [Gaiellaceae bacterium]